MSLGCGTWGGNITTENITVKNFMNVTWVSYPIPANITNADELFAPHFAKYGK
jgi:sulfoacetaldehyde dehydrogenase